MSPLSWGHQLIVEPGWCRSTGTLRALEQAEWEERNAVGFNLERLAERVDGLGWAGFSEKALSTE